MPRFPTQRAAPWARLSALLAYFVVTLLALCAPPAAAQDKFHHFPDRSVLLSKTRDAWFEATTPQELAADWSLDDPSLSFYTRAKNLTRFNTVVFIEVRLVGFLQDGYRHFQLSDSDVQRFLDASGINLNTYTYAITPSRGFHAPAGAHDNDDVNGRDDSYVDVSLEGEVSDAPAAAPSPADADSDGDDSTSASTVGTGHQLPVRQRVLFRVRHAPPALHERVAARIQAVVTEQARTHEQQRLAQPAAQRAKAPTVDKIWYHVPHEEVELVLRSDFEANSVSYTIYFMSPTAPTVGGSPAGAAAGSGGVPARYVYSQHARLEGLKTADPTLRRRPQCEAVHWASHQRFAFVDLTAGPVTFGPQASGDGVFAEASLPRLDRMFRRHDLEASMVTSDAIASAAEVDARAARSGTAGAGPDASADPTATGLGDHLRGFRAGSKTREVREARNLALRRAATEATAAGAAATGSSKQRRKAAEAAAAAAAAAKAGGGSDDAMSPMELVRRDYAAKKHEFVAELAQAVRSTAQALVLPPVWRFPVPFYETVLVNLIVIYDHELAVVEELARWKALAASLQNHAPPGQTVRVDVSHVQFEQCELCVAAYTHSLKTHTSNVMTAGAGADDASSGAGIRSRIHEYLDSDAMHDWLEHFERGFWNLRSGTVKETLQLSAKAAADKKKKQHEKQQQGKGGKASASAKEAEEAELTSDDVTATTVDATKATYVSPAEAAGSIRVVNAFVFDLVTAEQLLFDRLHQAVGFQDVAVAVQTRGELRAVDAVCNGQTMKLDPADASRALLGALLSTLYGVAPSGVGYSPAANATEMNHMWTVGMTPYGHFSQGLDSHFGLRDAAHRNVLLSEAFAVISNLKTLLNTMLRLRKDARELLSPAEYTQFNQRFNLLQFKLQKAENFASLNNYGDGLHYAISARHDVAAMQTLFRTAVRRVRPVLVCANEESAAEAAGAGVVETLIQAALTRILGSPDDAAATGPAAPGHKNITGHRAHAGAAARTVDGSGVSVHDDEVDDAEEGDVAHVSAADVESTERYTATFRHYEHKARLRSLARTVEVGLFALFVVLCVYLLCMRAQGSSTGNKQLDDAADIVLAAGSDAIDGLGSAGASRRGRKGCCGCREKSKYRD
jgi:hypothetical protein